MIHVHTHLGLGTDPSPPARVDAFLERAVGLAGHRDRLAPQTDVTLDEVLAFAADDLKRLSG